MKPRSISMGTRSVRIVGTLVLLVALVVLAGPWSGPAAAGAGALPHGDQRVAAQSDDSTAEAESTAESSDDRGDDDASSENREPGVGSRVSYVDTGGNEIGGVTVEDLIDPYEDFDNADPPKRGFRFVLVRVSVENNGRRGLEVDPETVFLQDTDGFIWFPTTVAQSEVNQEPALEAQAVAAGDSADGVIGFALPEEATIARVFYQPERDRLLLLANLGASGGNQGTAEPKPRATATPKPRPTATPKPRPTSTPKPRPTATPKPRRTPTADTSERCVDVAAWLVTTTVRVQRASAILDEVGDLDFEDPSVLDTVSGYATEFSDLADAQRNETVPPAAKKTNDLLTRAFQTFSDGFSLAVEGANAGDSDTIDQGIAKLTEAQNLTKRASTALDDLIKECGGGDDDSASLSPLRA